MRQPRAISHDSVTMAGHSATEAMSAQAKVATDAALAREGGLRRQLHSRQISMLAIGGAIGTGFFLGSAVSIQLAGPAVMLSYAGGSLIALALMWALGEMTVAHPVAGSFGVFAELYLHPWAGFAVRYSYWLGQAIAIGSEVIAASIYCRLWFPRIPGWIWIVAFSVALVYVNARAVGNFGLFEYWFAFIKVATICVFLVLGAALLLGIGFPRIGAANYTAHGGFLPHGWGGAALGVAMAVFSFIGIEVVAVASGETAQPEVAIPRALRWTLARLALFYVGGMAILVGVMPWTQLGLSESPFVRVFQNVGIPYTAGIMNFVVLTAALSSMNCNLYLDTRMLFSLARGGYAPRSLGNLNAHGAPLPALLISSVGMAIALVLELRFKDTAFLYMLGMAFFCGLFAWILIFLTHLFFRRHYTRKPGTALPARFAPRSAWTSVAGLLALVGVLISTWWIPGMRITITAGLPWLGFITVCYFVFARHRRPTAPEETPHG
ncbi:MAG TPA: amino acid permease [Candidatus Acidoferrales bacterium]|nr:amino acid permease [Candidatus Acidoferrales bacterium]